MRFWKRSKGEPFAIHDSQESVVDTKALATMHEVEAELRGGQLGAARNLLATLHPTVEDRAPRAPYPTFLIGALIRVAKYWVACERPQEALPWFQLACRYASRTDPQSMETAADFCYLGECHKSLGHRRDAAKAFRSAKKIFESLPAARGAAYLARVEQTLKELGG